MSSRATAVATKLTTATAAAASKPPSAAAADASKPPSATVAAATKSVSAMTTAATVSPALPPGFEEYILAQKASITAPIGSTMVAVDSPAKSDPKSAALIDDQGEETADDGLGEESEEGLDGLTSQLGNFSLNQDDEGGTFSFTSDRLVPAGCDGQPLDRLFTESVFSVNNSLCRISGKLQFALVWPWTWISCSGWFWYNDGFDIVNEGVSSMSKRHRGEENSSHDDDSTELN